VSAPQVAFVIAGQPAVHASCCATPRPDTWWTLRDRRGNFAQEIYCRACRAELGAITWHEDAKVPA
jgi:hypothetical protein